MQYEVNDEGAVVVFSSACQIGFTFLKSRTVAVNRRQASRSIAVLTRPELSNFQCDPSAIAFKLCRQLKALDET